MLFIKNAPLSVVPCPVCKASGYVGIRVCPTCKGMSVGRYVRGVFLYYGRALNRYHIQVRRARVWLYRLEITCAALIAVACGTYFFLKVSSSHLSSYIFTTLFWTRDYNGIQAFVWIAISACCFIVYRITRYHKLPVTVETHKRYAKKKQEKETVVNSWKDVSALPRRKRIDISITFTKEASEVMEQSFLLASEQNSASLSLEHVFYVLLAQNDIEGIFLRLGIPTSAMRKHIAAGFKKDNTRRMPVLSEDVTQIIFQAYEQAYEAHQDYVHVTELLSAAVGQSEQIQEMLYTLNIDAEKLKNVVEWVRIRERLHRQYRSFRKAAGGRDKHGLDKAMTAVATPFLNSYSSDMTMMAVYGHVSPCVAREKEIDGIFRVVESGRQSILLVGQHGVGKMSIMEGIVEKMIEEDVPARLSDKRMVQLSTSALMAGTTVNGAQERLLRIMHEVSKAGNIIMFVNNIQDLIGGAGESEGLDISESLAQFMESRDVLIFATTTPDGYNKHILNSQMGTTMARVEVEEMDINQTIQVLESKVGGVEYKHQVFFSYDALAAAADFAQKFLHEQNLPESAIELLSEAASYVRNKKGEHQLVQKDDIAVIVNEKTGIPASSISEDESEKLMRLEEEMHKRVIGQAEAVTAVSNALRRARAEIRSTKRPIANFLFLGSTGVGKTELAKTIAEVYFGGENRMIRVDMSEYQDESGIYRLIGQPGQQGTGLLTEAVRQHPFSLVLLDEMEKADPKILDLFLQVFDDGRLTDSVGRVIDFTNAILIATSNAGTSFIQEEIRKNTPVAEVTEQLMKTELKKYFRPEFLNRFDGIVTFQPLNIEDVKKIATLMLKRVTKDLEKRGVAFEVEPSGLDALIGVGFDPEFGARPMRRAIQNLVEDKLADLVLAGKLERKDTVVFTGEGMQVKRP